MAVRPIRLFPEPVLMSPTILVRDFGPALADLVKDLTDTMIHSPGVGLAAPQIGRLERVSVIDVGRNKRKPAVCHGLLVLVNPILMKGGGSQVPREGCLSVPDLLANVLRFQEVVVRFQNERGETQTLESSGFEALALQHEIDHLEGKLFLDRVSNIKTDLFRRYRH